jgi:hypothetical protein
MQDVQVLRNEAYDEYVGMTKGAAQRSRWVFHATVRKEQKIARLTRRHAKNSQLL